jgi:DNA repair photolyase
VVLRLPLEIKDLFREWLVSKLPDRAERVMSLVRQMRGGREYDAKWGKRMKGEGPIAELIGQRFKMARRRFGLDGASPPLDTSQFRVAAKAGDQLDLFV